MLKTEIAQQNAAMAESKTGGAGLFAKRVQKQFSRAQEKVLLLIYLHIFIFLLFSAEGCAHSLSFCFSKYAP